MAFSVNATRTVLWDQFQYDGSPADFSWVLPVLPGAYLEQASDAWFEALDAFTSTQVSTPAPTCAGAFSSSGQNGCGCGSSSDTAASGGVPSSNGGGGVQVLHEGTVGPYETVTLKSSDPNALVDWLQSHGYQVPDAIFPVIDAYVAEGWDFLAVRLAPDHGVQEMTPVRVVTPSGPSKLPLRMVAAGIGAFVDIELFIIGEDRFAMPDLPEQVVAFENLRFDFTTRTSNYLDLRSAALQKDGGRTYLVTFADKNPFTEQLALPTGGIASFTVTSPKYTAYYGSYTQLSDLYFAQAAADAGRAMPSCSQVTKALGDGLLVCDADKSPCSATEAPSTSYECDGETDVAAAMIGMHPSRVWLSRLEMRLPRTALNADCVVAPAVSQDKVSNIHQTLKVDNSPCPPPTFTGSGTQALLMGWAFGALAARRIERRRRVRA